MRIDRQAFLRERHVKEMIGMAISACPTAEHVIDLPYRLSSWALDDPGNVGIWRDANGDLVAWAVLQLPFWALDTAIHPEVDEELFPAVLHWATKRVATGHGTASERPCWFVHTFSDRSHRIRALEAAGYACQADVGKDSWSQVLLRRAGTAPLEGRPLPRGFTIRPLHGAGEIAAYVDLHRKTFGSENMTVEWRTRTLDAPHHHKQTDLVAVSDTGELAGFCIGWLAPGHRSMGQIEPLGVAPAFRGQGLGAALLTACLARLRELGADEVFVETDSFRDPALLLYRSAGFEPVKDILVYRKDFPGAARI